MLQARLSPWCRSILGVLLLTACSPPDDDRPRPLFEEGPFYSRPWPDDHRNDEDGTIRLAGFPNPGAIPLIDSYFAFGEKQVGYGTNSGIYLTLDGKVDPTLLPAPAESMEPDSALVLVDVDPESPFYGERFPVRWHEADVESAYQPPGLFVVAPVAGFPLRPATRYALLLTTAAFEPNPAFQEVFEPGNPRYDLWDPVTTALPLLGLKREDVAIGTVFTTTDPLADMKKLASYVRTRLAPPDLDQELEFIREYNDFTAYRTHYPSPVFTHGVRPYLTSGGNFEYDDAGDPIISQWDDLRMAICLPKHHEMPPEGWPVVIYQHGTGGNYRGFCNSNSALEAGRLLAEGGFIGLGIDQPLHGLRAGESNGGDLANFNILNPDSGTTNFLQGAVDALYLARTLAREPVQMRLPDGTPVVLDPNRVTFMGHSQGGMTGAVASVFWGGDVKASLLSGAGGILSITIVERDDIIDFGELVRQVARFDIEEDVYELHPLIGLIQMLAERTDMVNYSPYWYSEPLAFPDHRPSSVLLTSGTRDEATHYRSAVAMASAGRMPAIRPRSSSANSLDLRGLVDSPARTADNASSYEGPITAGLVQWTDGSHFIVFEEPQVAEMYVTYLKTGSEGAPLIDLPQGPLPR